MFKKKFLVVYTMSEKFWNLKEIVATKMNQKVYSEKVYTKKIF